MPNKSRVNKYFHFFSLVNPTLLSAALAIVLLFFFTSLALRHIHSSQERIVRAHLQTSLSSFAELIQLWQQQNLAAIHMLANSTQGKTLLKQVLLEQGDKAATHDALREWLYPVLMVMGFDGFSVINHERVLVAASTKAYRKQPVLLPETIEVLDKALAKRPAISRPVAAVLPIDGPRGLQPAGTLMQNMCVLFESEVTAPGYFCLRFNTQSSFFPIFFKGRTGRSGEIYAIDNRGRFVTPARFAPTQMDNSSTEAQQQAARIGAEVRRPLARGEQGPLTDMVDFLINREAGLIKVGYQDYRGISVAGAGRWIDEMELGVIIEQDVEEAMGPFLASRNIIIGLSVAANLLIVVLTITAILNRRSALMREGRFRSLLDNLPAATHMTSIDHQLIMVNPAFCSLLKLDESDLLGRDIHDVPAPNWLKPLLQAEENVGADSYWNDVVSELRHPDGNPRYYRIVRFPIIHTKGQEPQAITCIWVDVTERIVANQRMEEVNQNLEQMINERTHELMSAKDEALAASQTKAEFLANMSHEIRTPLNAIIGLAHIALASKPEPKQRTYLEKMRDSGEHLLQIINDILNFSRMEAGKLSLDHSEFSIDQLVDKTVDLVWDKAAAKGLQVNVEIDAQIPKVLLGDSLRLGQILINFCANAVKFTDHGSISIRVTKVRDWQERVELLFEVEDTGIGIDAEKVQNLFQPFQQVDSSSTRRFEGTGLGLSICKNLADLMQARIDVKSTEGQGSCFRLRVQLEKNNRAPAPNILQADPSPKKLAPIHCSILVVEDNLLNQEIILSLLESMEATAICVGSGPEAIAIIQQQAFDLVLMDIQLPGMDGVETTARIRELPVGKHLPIIAVTANALPGDREAYLAAGLDDYLSKPIEPAQLHSVLEQWGHACRVADDLVPKASSFEFLHNGGIDTARALHNLMDNETLYRRLLERFARERATFPAQLTGLLENNPAEALNQVHSLKSLAGSLGMSQLEIICFNLEQHLHNGEWQQELVDKLGVELTAMVELVSLGLNLQHN
ncbi:ATP-binding protein [Cellvibrio fibrivorans]|uniref:histidine kinase n=1 Tax=Cellvibrio fibrivorans TaxID=126350 RepID=A0ABU1V2B4_9GAMM|nr:ATP-binding protein [Cellvibrio fibrivorans]MDR7091592.1 PAS domain S-box-containing protein [Cellvibrio fibrivorans]